MITTLNQRWRDRRDSYRPAGEVLDPHAYEVAELEDDTTPRGFVEQHHYSGSYPAARWRFGLYRGGQLEGIAVFSHPSNDKVLAIFPGQAVESTELGRFVLLDQVPGNGETWFLARCLEQLRRQGVVGVVSFSDPMPRTSAAGARVFGGHVGTIYQASNAVYMGRATPRTLRLLPDGRVLNARTLQKIRKRERGYLPAVERLEQLGASQLGAGDPYAWLEAELPKITRTVRHPGNHRYAWMLDRRHRRHLPASLPYPKFQVA